MRRRFTTAGLVLALIVSVLVGTGGSASADSPDERREREEMAGVGTVAWGACEPDSLLDQVGAECGLLSVPLDWSRPKGQKIQLALSRLKADPTVPYQGIMLVNPGGPGGSGTVFAFLQLLVPNDAGMAYDWIGFDPRGVGDSVPAISCDPDYAAPIRPPYEPTSPGIEKAWLTRASGYAADCARNNGPLLSHVTTVDNVKDMNAIRFALGQKQLNFYGFSYGTYLGQVYATLYPDKVRRMVLDANVDPRQIWYDGNLGQDPAFEAVIDRMWDWIARHDDAYHLGTTAAEVEKAYYDALHGLAAQPGGNIGAAEWNDAFVVAGYLQVAWPDVAAAFAAWVNDGDIGPATDLFLANNDIADDNGYAMYLGTSCGDARWPRDWKVWRRDNTRIAVDAPFITWNNAWFNAPCAFWPVRGGQPVNVKGKEAPPILLLSETLDAATPYSGSLEVRQRFPRATLIATEGGTTHANSLAGNPCVDDPIAAYLADGTLPPRLKGKATADVVCPAAPEPEPTPAAATAATGAARSLGISSAELHRRLATMR